MLKFRSSPFEEEIEKATDEKNLTEDWSLIMHICDNATNYQDGSKYCLKAILKRLNHNVPRVVLQTLTLLDACVKNCDRSFLLQVASSEFTTEVRKLLSKMHPSASTKLKELLQKWSMEEFKNDPELCIIPSLYYKLKSEGVEFPPLEKEKKTPQALSTNPDVVNSQEEENDIIKALEISLKDTGRYDTPVEYGNSAADSSKNLREPFKVRALYDFDAAEDNELTIKIGEIVLVLDNTNSSWWKGSNHRGEGLFPANFVTEDLDAKPEEPISVTSTVTIKTDESSVVEEVKIDEEKIETVLNWLNETDPTGDMTDPEEMLLLEKECYRMAPLIEENLQAVDNRLAMLNLVNEKIMDAFDLFHSLSDQWTASNPGVKSFPFPSYSSNTLQFAHPQMSFVPPTSVMHERLQHPVMPQAQSLSAALSNSQTISHNQVHYEPVRPFQTGTLPKTQVSAAENVSHIVPPKATEPSQAAHISNAVPVSQVPVSQTSALANNLAGSCFMPSQAMPYPMQCFPNMPNQGYIQAPAPTANYMGVPYPVPPVGPYFPVAYYYVNNVSSESNVTTLSGSINSSEPVQSQAPTNIAAQTSTTSVVSNSAALPNYSSDLQHVTLSSSLPVKSESSDQVNVPAMLPDVNNHISSNQHLVSYVSKKEEH